MLVGPSKCLKQIIQIELNRAKKSQLAEGKPAGYLITSMAENLNAGLPWTNPASGQLGETLTRGLRTFASLEL